MNTGEKRSRAKIEDSILREVNKTTLFNFGLLIVHVLHSVVFRLILITTSGFRNDWVPVEVLASKITPIEYLRQNKLRRLVQTNRIKIPIIKY